MHRSAQQDGIVLGLALGGRRIVIEGAGVIDVDGRADDSHAGHSGLGIAHDRHVDHLDGGGVVAVGRDSSGSHDSLGSLELAVAVVVDVGAFIDRLGLRGREGVRHGEGVLLTENQLHGGNRRGEVAIHAIARGDGMVDERGSGAVVQCSEGHIGDMSAGVQSQRT